MNANPRPHSLINRRRLPCLFQQRAGHPLITATATLSEDAEELAVLLLNKSTKTDFGIELRLADFPAQDTYEITALSTKDPSAHEDIFEINPWRLSQSSTCAPPGGGCTPTLTPETGENVILRTETRLGAGSVFSIKVQPHSATLLRLQRRKGTPP